MLTAAGGEFDGTSLRIENDAAAPGVVGPFLFVSSKP